MIHFDLHPYFLINSKFFFKLQLLFYSFGLFLGTTYNSPLGCISISSPYIYNTFFFQHINISVLSLCILRGLFSFFSHIKALICFPMKHLLFIASDEDLHSARYFFPFSSFSCWPLCLHLDLLSLCPRLTKFTPSLSLL